jgi:hypothetical protein
MQFHFAPLTTAEVEGILKEKTDKSPGQIRQAAQLSEGSPGLALEMDVETAARRRQSALRVLEHAAKGRGFAQLFAETSAIAKDREDSFEAQLVVFYGLLTDLLELTSGTEKPLLRNPALAKDLEILSKTVDSPWVMRAIEGLDEVSFGARRNLNRQLGLDALAVSLAPGASKP